MALVSPETGNALLYVLIAIVLFAALSMTLGRQAGTDEISTLPKERAALYTTQLESYAAQAKSAIDQMRFAGTPINSLDFTAPTDPAFETEPPKNIFKVFHPSGGGLTPATLPAESITQIGSTPVPGWYIGRFNNVEWTATTGQDVILTAYQIQQTICENINLKLTGSTTVPTLTDTIQNTLIDDLFHAGTNTTLTTDGGDICPSCENRASLCVKDAGGAYAFYTILADQ